MPTKWLAAKQAFRDLGDKNLFEHFIVRDTDFESSMDNIYEGDLLYETLETLKRR